MIVIEKNLQAFEYSDIQQLSIRKSKFLFTEH